jgi:hypothetical protein
MKKLLALVLFSLAAHAQTQPDYSEWARILTRYYDPALGMNYAQLKAHDAAALENLRQSLGRVNADALHPKQRLAYWINVYNINTVATIVESYPVKSIRDLSTDPLIFTVFKKPRVPYGGQKLSLDDVESKKIRDAFHDPRIHFAINCAAKSCPPLRIEPYISSKIDGQLDDQTRRFLSGMRVERKGDTAVAHVTKIMDWFAGDFGDRVGFLRRYGPPALSIAKSVEIEFDDYDWSLNDRK